MKKTMRVSLIVAVIAIAVGSMLSVSAFAAMGFDITEMNSMNFVNQTYTVEEAFNSIFIDGAECSVRFVPSENEMCRIDCYEGDKIYHTVAVEDGTLTVKRVDRRKWYERIGIYWGEMEITVFLPETEYSRLYIRTLSGDIEISDAYRFSEAEIYNTSGDVSFCAEVESNLFVKTVSGDLNLTGTNATTVTAQSTSGDVSVSSVEATESLRVKATSGDIVLSNVVCGNLHSSNTSGDSEFDGVIVENDVVAETVSGDMSFRSSDAKTLRLTSTSGDIHGTLLTAKTFAIETVSGEVRVPNSAIGGRCEIVTTSGDVSFAIQGG